MGNRSSQSSNNTQNEIKERKHKIWMERIGAFIALAGLMFVVLNYVNSQKEEPLVIENPLKGVSIYPVEQKSGDSFDPNSIQGKLLRKFNTDHFITQLLLYEYNGVVNVDDSTANGIIFNIHNKNNFSIPIESVSVEVTSFYHCDSYLLMLFGEAGENPFQSYTCNIKPRSGLYIAQYEPFSFEDEPTEKYLKVDANDSEAVCIHLNKDNPDGSQGIYNIRVIIQYSLNGKPRADKADFQLVIYQEPSNINYSDCSLYYESGYEQLDDNTAKQYALNSTDGLCPNFINMFDRDTKLQDFLSTHYNNSPAYFNATREVLQFLDSVGF